MNIYFDFYFSLACYIVTNLLILVNIHYFDHTFSYAHIEAHTHSKMPQDAHKIRF